MASTSSASSQDRTRARRAASHTVSSAVKGITSSLPSYRVSACTVRITVIVSRWMKNFNVEKSQKVGAITEYGWKR